MPLGGTVSLHRNPIPLFRLMFSQDLTLYAARVEAQRPHQPTLIATAGDGF